MKRRKKNRHLVVAVHAGTFIKSGFAFISGLLLIFIITGALTSLRPELRLSSSSINGVAAEIPGSSFLLLLASENKYFAAGAKDQEINFHLSSIMLKLATSINLEDPRSFLGRELPGFSQFDTEILVAGEGTDYTNMPYESAPPADVLEKEKEANLAELEQINPEKKEESPKETPKQTTGDRKVVYIYNTHNTESYLPLLKGETDPNRAFHSKANVTLVSDMLGKSLKAEGLGSEVEKKDFQASLNKKGWNYTRSYEESRSAVREALAANKEFAYTIDIHRDVKRLNGTLKEINGKKYAKVAFIVGTNNSSFSKNHQVATELHKLLEKKYKGVSRGVFKQGGSRNNGVYNQDLSQNALLIEFGGVDNNLEQLRNSADAIADVFSEMYWDADKVNTKANEKVKQ
ncbi:MULTISPECIES: stage II sporulation protein P [Bacillus]|uniref:Stage II sporulation protein P n=2 Tax=Bacillus TaxID=1386 RepID=A0A0M4FQV4_9BACI|nr:MULTISPECIES: stage II sporulation protein P [Bacillus]ALC81685.1 stage II sporulation protein P [Bacillus gobiensis]MBP1080736.1 stage II sporulation protein P [Bacillus capparidis]MED1094592.1 stage II sporulation protein P [Bacillus capparidis]